MASFEEEDNQPILNQPHTPVSCTHPILPIYSRRGTGKKISALIPVGSSPSSMSSSVSSSPLLNEFRTYLPTSDDVQVSSVEKYSSEEDYRSAAIHGYAIGMLGGNVLSPNFLPTRDNQKSPLISPVYSVAPVPLSSFSIHAQCNLSEMERSCLSGTDFGSGSFFISASSNKERALCHQASAGDFSLQSGFLDKDDEGVAYHHHIGSHHRDPFSFFPPPAQQNSRGSFCDERPHTSTLSTEYSVASLMYNNHFTVGDLSEPSLRFSLSCSLERRVEEAEAKGEIKITLPHRKNETTSVNEEDNHKIHRQEDTERKAEDGHCLSQELKRTRGGKLIRSSSAPAYMISSRNCCGLGLQASIPLDDAEGLSAFWSPPNHLFLINSKSPLSRSALESFKGISVVSSLKNSDQSFASMLVRSSQGSSTEGGECVLSNHHFCSDGVVDVHFRRTETSPFETTRLRAPFALVQPRRRKNDGDHLTSDPIPIVRILSTSKLFLRVSPPTWNEVQGSTELIDSVRSSVTDI